MEKSVLRMFTSHTFQIRYRTTRARYITRFEFGAAEGRLHVLLDEGCRCLTKESRKQNRWNHARRTASDAPSSSESHIVPDRFRL
ncbi:hypothetical protein TGRH88_004200 [Toxoplasma gondii]|uniref:Uncharacterized protein n=1 Tax=Toxoplasma gondii TaxID=5811 RepID=A0A7J6KDU6_TOXGO|nr:hypothetical protein TGRH88_004200 [Toxoplasma gondii]